MNANTNIIKNRNDKPVDIYKNIIKSKGNIKLGENIGTISKVYGDAPIWVDKLQMYVTGTCGGHCAGCKEKCYVRASYRYGSVIFGHAKTTLAFREDIARAFASMDAQMDRKRKPFKIIRVNQSGEIESTTELVNYMWIAKRHPHTMFYLYTKNFDALKETILLEALPKNITILISVWHEYGLDVYKELQHIKQIKAYVYLDTVWTPETYAAHGLIITAYCKAYDEHGKLDHNETCSKCHKCYDRIPAHKVIGCWAH